MLSTPSWPLMSIKENIGRSMTSFWNNCFKRDVDLVCLRCSDGARPKVLPEALSVSRENLEGRQYANAMGIVELMVGRWNESVGRVQVGYGRS